MKKRNQKILMLMITFVSLTVMSMNCYAHSGRTDANGGHKDNQNKSGLGSYHYHCGGHPAHLHTNGVCPYASNTKTKSTQKATPKSNTQKINDTQKTTPKSNVQKSTTTTVEPVKTTQPETQEQNIPILPEKITLKCSKTEIQIGENSIIEAHILPENVTDKSIEWTSSDEKIATVDEMGKVIGKAEGNVTIQATLASGKTEKINIIVKQKENERQNLTNTIQEKKEKQDNPVGGLIAIGLLAGGGYLAYRKFKK